HIRKFIEATSQPVKREDASSLLRLLHTLKAAVKHFHLEEMGKLIHHHELNLRSDLIRTDQEFMSQLSEARKDIEKGLNDVLEQVRDLIGQDYEGRGNMHEVEEQALYEFAKEMEIKHAD